MKRAFFRLIFFEIVTILFFIFVHVDIFDLGLIKTASIVGAIGGLVLFILSLILFPIRAKRKKDKPDQRLQRREIKRDYPVRQARNDRHFQDTDKIIKP